MTNGANCHHAGAAYIGLGSNLGDRLATLNQAVARLETLGSVTTISAVYETDPVGFAEQPSFLNAVVCLQTTLAPVDLLAHLLRIEGELGRVRIFPNAPRTIDLDLLMMGETLIQSANLHVPHPRLHERAFILVPLAEVAPDIVHPALGVSIRELLQRLAPVIGVCQIANSLTRGSVSSQ